jgi:tetratricopeptide (TPR) repeat protein
MTMAPSIKTRFILASASLLFLFVSATTFAQKSKVVNAYNYKKSGEFLKAKENIDAATLDAKTGKEGKTWAYRGDIYTAIYDSRDEKYKDLKSTALHEANLSYEKAIKYGSKSHNESELKMKRARLANLFFQEGVRSYNKKTYKEALQQFETCFTIKKSRGETDSLALSNMALAAEMMEDYDLAIKHYQSCIEIGYNVVQMYGDCANILMKQGKDDEAVALLTDARKKYPKEQDLLTLEINLFLKNNKYEKALSRLDLAIENDSKNAVLFYARATVYLSKWKGNNVSKATENYKKAIELNPNYFDANYNLGALFFNLGADQLNEANKLTVTEEYNAKKAEAVELFQKAIPYLEKAHELDAKNKPTMNSLKELYARTGQQEKYDAISAKLNK